MSLVKRENPEEDRNLNEKEEGPYETGPIGVKVEKSIGNSGTQLLRVGVSVKTLWNPGGFDSSVGESVRKRQCTKTK